MGQRWDIKNDAGAALIIALGVMSIMIIIGITVTALAINSNSTVTHDIKLTEAQNIAEAGVEDVIEVTLQNYDDIYPNGNLPDYYTGDGVPFYDNPQLLTDAQGNIIGTYEVWTKEDPERPGNVLITSKGTKKGVNGADVDTSTVLVSVKYTNSIFDYVLLPGTPDNPSDTTLFADSSGGYDGSDGINSIVVTGKTHVNGDLTINTPSAVGDHGSDDRSGRNARNPGTITFLSRDGYNDTVTYTGTFTGDTPSGIAPAQGDAVDFPAIDFDAFADVITVHLPSSGYPSGGWSRSGPSSPVFTISAEDFEAAYGSYDVVKLTASNDNATVEITGDCNMSTDITSTIMVPGVSSQDFKIKELDLVGPGISLQPENGLAILSGEGKVSLQNGVIVGSEGAGALIYLSGQNGVNNFEVTGSFDLWGSVVVNSDEVYFGAAGGNGCSVSGDNGSDDGGHDGHGGDDDSHHGDGTSTADISLTFDPAYLDNMPTSWWSGGDLSAVKENFERE
jgi:hypothetical protein